MLPQQVRVPQFRMTTMRGFFDRVSWFARNSSTKPYSAWACHLGFGMNTAPCARSGSTINFARLLLNVGEVAGKYVKNVRIGKPLSGAGRRQILEVLQQPAEGMHLVVEFDFGGVLDGIVEHRAGKQQGKQMQ